MESRIEMTALRRAVMVSLLAAVVLAGASAGAATGQPPPPVSSPPLDRLADCVSANERLAVVLLVDESGSLQETDPAGGRVDAAKAAVAGLAGLVDRSEGRIVVDLQVAGFGVDFESGAPWQRVDGAGRGAIDGRIEEFRNRNSAIDTDYVNALQGALESVQRRGRELQGGEAAPACTAVMWFTDGKYDVIERDTEERKEAGRDNRGVSQNKVYAPGADLYRSDGPEQTMGIGRSLLCDPGGIADQYRATGTTLLGVALTKGITREEDQRFLGALVANGDPAVCAIGAGGQLLSDSDVSGLAPLFDRIVADLGDPTEVADLCPENLPACPTGRKTFFVDGYMNRFHVLVQLNEVDGADSPQVRVLVTPPGPGVAPLDIPARAASAGSGSETRGSTTTAWSWISERALTIDAAAGEPQQSWAGEWAVDLIALPGTSPEVIADVTVYLYGEFSPRMVQGTEFRAGERNEFTVELARPDGSVIQPGSLAAPVEVTAQVISPTCVEGSGAVAVPCPGSAPVEQTLRLTDTGWGGEFVAPPALAAVPLQVRLTVRTAVPNEVSVNLSEATVPVPILPPLGFPTIRPQFLSIGPIEGTDTFGVVVTAVGSDLADGCVWLRGYESTPGTPPISDLQFTVEGAGRSLDQCLQVPRNAEVEFLVQVTPETEARGFTTGTLTFGSKSDNGEQIRDLPLDVLTELVKPASAGLAWALFVVMLLAGVGIPLLAFYLSNWLVARFAPLRLLQACSVRVAIANGRVEREHSITTGRLLDPKDFSNHTFGADANSGERQRRFTWRDAGLVVPFTARVSRNPLRPPFGLAGDGDRPVIGSDRGNVSGVRGRVPLWVTREWIFLPDDVDDADAPVAGRLVAFVLATDRATAVPLLEGQLVERLPSLEALARRVRRVRRPVPGAGGGSQVPDAGGPPGDLDYGDTAPWPTATMTRGSTSLQHERPVTASQDLPPYEENGPVGRPTPPTSPTDRAPWPDDPWGDTPPTP